MYKNFPIFIHFRKRDSVEYNRALLSDDYQKIDQRKINRRRGVDAPEGKVQSLYRLVKKFSDDSSMETRNHCQLITT